MKSSAQMMWVRDLGCYALVHDDSGPPYRVRLSIIATGLSKVPFANFAKLHGLWIYDGDRDCRPSLRGTLKSIKKLAVVAATLGIRDVYLQPDTREGGSVWIDVVLNVLVTKKDKP